MALMFPPKAWTFELIEVASLRKRSAIMIRSGASELCSRCLPRLMERKTMMCLISGMRLAIQKAGTLTLSSPRGNERALKTLLRLRDSLSSLPRLPSSRTRNTAGGVPHQA